MKVIFLDFDGVLNTYSYMFLTDGDAPEDGLDPRHIRHVNEIIRQTGAVIVLSTAWRYEHSQAALNAMLEKRGLCGKVISMTPEPSQHVIHEPRENEIRAWLAVHSDVESFVVLDDLAEFGGMKDRHINTDPSRGLLVAHIAAAVNILSTPKNERVLVDHG